MRHGNRRVWNSAGGVGQASFAVRRSIQGSHAPHRPRGIRVENILTWAASVADFQCGSHLVRRPTFPPAPLRQRTGYSEQALADALPGRSHCAVQSEARLAEVVAR